jgi:hypothetical protein
MVLNALWTDPVNTGITFGIIIAGIPAYLAWTAWGRSRAPGPPAVAKKTWAADEPG